MEHTLVYSSGVRLQIPGAVLGGVGGKGDTGGLWERQGWPGPPGRQKSQLGENGSQARWHPIRESQDEAGMAALCRPSSTSGPPASAPGLAVGPAAGAS
eukprot:gene16418-biopygen20280